MTSTKKLVLIVDDSTINRQVATHMLIEAGYITISANNGQEAVQKVKELSEQICLILMDQNMPLMNGTDAAKIIKEAYPSLPIVELTTEEDPTILKEFINSGVLDIYKKPITSSCMNKLTRKYSK